MDRLAFESAGRLGDFAVPPTCLACDAIMEERGGCCATCRRKLHFTAAPICAVSGVPFAYNQGPDAVSPDVIARPPPPRRCRSAVVYDDNARLLETSLKYGDRLDLAPWMAKWIANAGRALMEEKPVVVPGLLMDDVITSGATVEAATEL